MRVLFVTHSFPRFSGDAAGAFILRLARALADTGTEVRVLAPMASGLAADDTIDGVAVHRYRYAPRRWETLAYCGTMAEQATGSIGGAAAMAAMLVSGQRAARRACAAFAPDIVHAHWWFPAGIQALPVSAAPPGAGARLVTTLHGSDVRLAQGSAARKGFRVVMARSSAVTAVSSYLASEARTMAPGTGIAVAPMPVDVELFAPPPPDGAPARAANRFLFVGRLNAQKGIALLLDALASVTATTAPTLDVAGDGPDRAALEHRARSLQVADRVRWLGARTQQQLAPLYHEATAVIVPSENEGLGLVAVEAQLAGAPVIAFRSGGLTDVIEDGVTGVLTPPGDVRALAAAMDALLAHPGRGAAFAQAARGAALARFSPAAAAARYSEIYAAASAPAARSPLSANARP